MNLDIRHARREDLPAILRLGAQDSFSHAWESAMPGAEHYRAFDLIDAHPDHKLIVGERNGEVIAALQLSFIPGLGFRGAWRAQLEAVRVRKDLRGQGIGSAVIRWAIEQARARHCALVQLTTNRERIDARRFYERLGFQPSHVGMKLFL